MSGKPSSASPRTTVLSLKRCQMKRELLKPGCLYHIYNHAVGKDKLFLSEENYNYFLRRYKHFVPPVADTYAYCLIPNHIHFSVKIKQQINVPSGSRYSASQYVSKQFSNLFSSYAQAFNKQQKRMGNLFISNFKRKKIDTDDYRINVIKYIHLNPVTCELVRELSHWKFSSFNAICSKQETFLAREEVLAWFGGIEGFRRGHEGLPRFPKV